MRDSIYESFLAKQEQEGFALARSSDILELFPAEPSPAQRYLGRFLCKGLVRAPSDEIEVAERFEVGISFGSDYLRRADGFQVLTWLGPRRVFHPNISDLAPVICIGRIAPATPLTDLLHRCYEVISYQRFTPREDDALNVAACAWARRNQHRFPVDDRPLKRRAVAIRAEITDRRARK